MERVQRARLMGTNVSAPNTQQTLQTVRPNPYIGQASSRAWLFTNLSYFTIHFSILTLLIYHVHSIFYIIHFLIQKYHGLIIPDLLDCI